MKMGCSNVGIFANKFFVEQSVALTKDIFRRHLGNLIRIVQE
jgi:hypothetical protein